MRVHDEITSLSTGRTRHAVLLELCRLCCVIKFKNNVSWLQSFAVFESHALLVFVHPVVKSICVGIIRRHQFLELPIRFGFPCPLHFVAVTYLDRAQPLKLDVFFATHLLFEFTLGQMIARSDTFSTRSLCTSQLSVTTLVSWTGAKMVT